MPAAPIAQTRRAAIAAGLAAGAAAVLTPEARADSQTGDRSMADDLFHTGALGDWDFLVGSWAVRHSRLKQRLVGDTEWEAFDGTCVMWKTMGGAGNVDDNMLELPAGTYRAMGMRAFNPETRQWSIWWLDGRGSQIDPPVRGGFRDGVGVFIGDDQHRGTPVKARFRWSRITATSAHWEQAFSTDGGATWETNWRMDFTRTA